MHGIRGVLLPGQGPGVEMTVGKHGGTEEAKEKRKRENRKTNKLTENRTGPRTGFGWARTIVSTVSKSKRRINRASWFLVWVSRKKTQFIVIMKFQLVVVSWGIAASPTRGGVYVLLCLAARAINNGSLLWPVWNHCHPHSIRSEGRWLQRQ
jgi:hypothetical protein